MSGGRSTPWAGGVWRCGASRARAPGRRCTAATRASRPPGARPRRGAGRKRHPAGVYSATCPVLPQRELDRLVVSTGGEQVNRSAFEDALALVSFPNTFRGAVPPVPQLVLDTVRHFADASGAVLSNVLTTYSRQEQSTPPPQDRKRGEGTTYTNVAIPSRCDQGRRDKKTAQRRAKVMKGVKNTRIQERLRDYVCILKQIVRETERLNEEWEVMVSDLKFV